MTFHFLRGKAYSSTFPEGGFPLPCPLLQTCFVAIPAQFGFMDIGDHTEKESANKISLLLCRNSLTSFSL